MVPEAVVSVVGAIEGMCVVVGVSLCLGSFWVG